MINLTTTYNLPAMSPRRGSPTSSPGRHLPLQLLTLGGRRPEVAKTPRLMPQKHKSLAVPKLETEGRNKKGKKDKGQTKTKQKQTTTTNVSLGVLRIQRSFESFDKSAAIETVRMPARTTGSGSEVWAGDRRPEFGSCFVVFPSSGKPQSDFADQALPRRL